MILCHFDELKLRMFVLFHMEPCVDFNVKYNVKVVKLKKIQAELVSLHKHSEINKHLLCCDHVSLGLGVTILKRVYHVFTYSSHNSKIDMLWHCLQRNKALNRDPYIKTNKKTHVNTTIQLDTLKEIMLCLMFGFGGKKITIHSYMWYFTILYWISRSSQFGKSLCF